MSEKAASKKMGRDEAAARYGDMAAMMLFREASIGKSFTLTPVKARAKAETVTPVVEGNELVLEVRS